MNNSAVGFYHPYPCPLSQPWWGLVPPACTCNKDPITWIVADVPVLNYRKPRIKKENGYWILISPCGNFKEQYSSWNQLLRRLNEIK